MYDVTTGRSSKRDQPQRDVPDPGEYRAAAIGTLPLAFIGVCLSASGRLPSRECLVLLLSYLRIASSLWVFSGLAVLLVAMVRAPREDRRSAITIARDGLRARWAESRCLGLFWPPLAFAILLTSFNVYKQTILPLAGTGCDPLFATIDHLLFLGHEPWLVVHRVFASPWASYVLDLAYHGWFAPMSIGMIICAWAPPHHFQLKTQYLFAYIGVWIVIGGVFAFAWPAVGPAFYAAFGHGDRFLPLVDKLSSDQSAISRVVAGTKLMSIDYQHELLAIYDGPHLALGGGISAMPSVHNALAVLFALAGRAINRRLGTVLTAYAVLIWLGSIDLGWHYAVDGIVAALMTVALWRLAGRLAARLERPLFPSRPNPVLAG